MISPEDAALLQREVEALRTASTTTIKNLKDQIMFWKVCVLFITVLWIVTSW